MFGYKFVKEEELFEMDNLINDLKKSVNCEREKINELFDENERLKLTNYDLNALVNTLNEKIESLEKSISEKSNKSKSNNRRRKVTKKTETNKE